jgi:hypothetical protein
MAFDVGLYGKGAYHVHKSNFVINLDTRRNIKLFENDIQLTEEEVNEFNTTLKFS